MTSEPNISGTARALLQDVALDARVQRLCTSLGADAELHLVGGIVRDTILGRSNSDIDLASRLRPDELLSRLERAGVRVIPTGLQHQTVTVVPVMDWPALEITTFRGPNMSPLGGVVAAERIEEDLQFRDFTVNALAYRLSDGALFDCDNGLADLDARIIRAVGNATERFTEDPLRILRMVRFAAQLGFTVDAATMAASRSFGECIANVSVERVRDEFGKILLTPRPAWGIRMLEELGFLRYFLPELSNCVAFEQNDFHSKDVFEHTLEVVEKTRSEIVLRLAALLHDIGKPPSLTVDEDGHRHFYLHECIGAEMSELLLQRLRYPTATVENVVTLVRTHMRPTSAAAPGIRRLLRDTGDLYDLWRELKEADATSTRLEQQQLREELVRFDENVAEVKKGPNVSPLKNLAIGGKDLIALGLIPGPRFGEILRALHERVLDEPALNSKDSLLPMALALAQDGDTKTL